MLISSVGKTNGYVKICAKPLLSVEKNSMEKIQFSSGVFFVYLRTANAILCVEGPLVA